MRSAIITLFLLIAGITVVIAQQKNLDSLYLDVQHLDDSARLAAYSSFAAESTQSEEIQFWIDKINEENQNADSVYWNAMQLHHSSRLFHYSGELRKEIVLRERAVEKFQGLGKESDVSKQYNNLGNAYADMGIYDSASFYYESSLAIAQNQNNPRNIASAYLNIATVHNNTGNKEQELSYIMKTVDIARKNDLDDILAKALFNLSVHYAYSMNFDKSEELCKELSILYKKTNDLEGFALLNNVRAKLAFDQNKPEEALVYLDSAMLIYKQQGFLSRVASIQLNMGQVNAEMRNYEKARKYLWDSYEVFVQINDLRYSAIALHDLSLVFSEQNLHEKAIRYMKKAIQICDSIGVLGLQTFYTNELAEVYKNASKVDLAYQAMRDYKNLNDSLSKQNSFTALREMETKFQTERKQLEIENLQQEKALQEAEIDKEHNRSRILYGGLAASIILIVIVSFAFIQKKKDHQLIQIQRKQLIQRNEELNDQKDIVEEKNREITDSINYARKIQDAVLPPVNFIKKYIQNSFVLYLPKDIVAGDFYWFKVVEDKLLIAVADCTGHGVPGAMVSVVCSNALNRSVAEFGLSRPAEILNKCQELVVENLGNSTSEIKDGMDIALCSFDKSLHNVEYAGAHNALWVVGEKPETKSTLMHFETLNHKGDLHELKADKQAIGQTDNFKYFTNHKLKLKAGSRLYLFSDGYLDQFGGLQGKKLKSRNLKDLILKNQDLPIQDQGQELKRQFTEWKGDLEQLDDVCIIGISV